MGVQSFVGKQEHTDLMQQGFSSDQANHILGLPNIDAAKIQQWISTKGPVALRMLKILLPALVNDPELVTLLSAMIDKALAG